MEKGDYYELELNLNNTEITVYTIIHNNEIIFIRYYTDVSQVMYDKNNLFIKGDYNFYLNTSNQTKFKEGLNLFKDVVSALKQQFNIN